MQFVVLIICIYSSFLLKMNVQQVMQTGSSSNGYGRRRADKGTVTRFDSKFNAGTTNSGRIDFGKRQWIIGICECNISFS